MEDIAQKWIESKDKDVAKRLIAFAIKYNY